MNVFEDAYKEVMGNEGGYGNNPSDPGGETYKGVARNRWPSWSGWSIVDYYKKTHSSDRALTEALGKDAELQKQVHMFYKAHFWDVVWGDELAKISPELAIDMFDMSVNLGSGRGTEFIQRICNAFNNRAKLYGDIIVDGSFGPNTIRAVRSCAKYRGWQDIYKGINVLQGAWYIELMERNESNERFYGWFKRVDFVKGNK